MDAKALASLDREAYVSLATRRRDGRWVETPVWFAALDGRLYVFTAADAGKLKRLRNFAEIRVAPCSVRGVVHGEWRPGRGSRIEDAARIEAAYAALRRKYGWQMWVTDFFSRLTGRIGSRVMIELELDR